MRGWDYKKGMRGMSSVRSELNILRHVFIKETLRLHARNDYRLGTMKFMLESQKKFG